MTIEILISTMTKQHFLSVVQFCKSLRQGKEPCSYWHIDESNVDTLVSQNIFSLVAINSNRDICGLATLKHCGQFQKHLGEVSVAVGNEYRKKGIGSKLLHALTSLAETRNIKLLKAAISDTNIPSIELFKKNGFIRKATLYDEFRSELTGSVNDHLFYKYLDKPITKEQIDLQNKAHVLDHELWDDKAAIWHERTGDEGDRNRQLNSDPVLWRMLHDAVGDLKSLSILDAGCGTGYLAIKMAKKGASVVGVDYSEKMISIANKKNAEGLDVHFQRDSIETLTTLQNESFDVVISNYVLMDAENLDNVISSLNRVLKTSGHMILVFSHPSFGPPGGGTVNENDQSVSFRWPFSYFDSKKLEDRWGPFQTHFVFYHRPLSVYWKTFKQHGFDILDFDEPVMHPPYDPKIDPELILWYRMNPFSVAFLLKKVR